jgi:putative ABC transport system permease protein
VTTSAPLPPARLLGPDIARVGVGGLRAHPVRAVLSALGIAIGIAAMLAVVGISTSSKADLNRTLDRLGTNLLTVRPNAAAGGAATRLPIESIAMVGRIGPVTSVSAVGRVSGHVYRNDFIPPEETNSIAVLAARQDVLAAVSGQIHVGDWLNDATASYPAVVLGDGAARRLGLRAPGARVWIGDQWFGVAGILDPVALADELDSAALVGWPTAQRYLHFDGHPTTLYVRSVDAEVEAVRGVLGATANPAAPNEVQVSRPSDALAARRATNQTLNSLLLGLAAVALLVGGIGVANTMIIAVLERRWEIGLRRSLGATRAHIRTQFLAESLLLSALGGLGGVLLGTAVTVAYASAQSWPTVIPLWAVAGGLGATLVIGALSGLYPAIRASRLAPTEALAAP